MVKETVTDGIKCGRVVDEGGVQFLVEVEHMVA